ncbi:SusD/RagB family nutrient-binding outer membrane lipoprotein [Adhaeribacter pallidiroseus]|uniref:Starch-binding associating with outer membrane n=1 Tax=Adhaeribacter pallidiroseus TaxID=2072847 RepID=A0A369QHX8_9BACT|nr:SusD/RagB family nutrient-binding outer membrane lipoprotein [Adhaeribacter pallidiroseus]RDC64491.1 hypothetical protein AHMF7616_03105 [Adhaeribacter pallidiroseus]
MKNKFIYHTLLLVLGLAFSSCENFLDVNTNPNAATTVDPKLLFSNATVNWINSRSGGDLYIPTALAGQSIASGGNNPTGWGIPSEEQYQISPFSTGNTWRANYTSVGSNLTEAIRLAESAVPARVNAAAQSKVMLAMVVYETTTLYGDIPFSEAWNVEIAAPKFDPQPQVLEGVLSLLDEALAQFDLAAAPALKISDYDLFYKGDLTKWQRLAKSVKLRTLLTMVDKDPSKAAVIGQLVTEGGMISSAADNFLVNYEATAGKRNPKFGLSDQYNAGTPFFFGSKYVVDFMNSIKDPRLPKFFDKPAGAANYVGVQPGEDGDDDVNVRIAKSLHRADAPDVIFSYQEQLFYEAEVNARGLGIPVNLAAATTLYRKAAEESSKFFGVDAATAATFAASLTDLTTLSNREAVKLIHYHNWVDKMDRGVDAFTQWRRSGPEGDEVPNLTLPVGAPAGGLFRRFEYPATNEIASNPNAPQELIPYNSKMWFDL